MQSHGKLSYKNDKLNLPNVQSRNVTLTRMHQYYPTTREKHLRPIIKYGTSSSACTVGWSGGRIRVVYNILRVPVDTKDVEPKYRYLVMCTKTCGTFISVFCLSLMHSVMDGHIQPMLMNYD